jgi:hypothetical protein
VPCETKINERAFPHERDSRLEKAPTDGAEKSPKITSATCGK